ncbi:acyl-CoA dehydrogenase [Pikeienuella piscinae]|uniref:Acyl-coenzyme A dehydrogenase n=1 Tax=Pikeienuella piscinae TaxID=2748098 RepID=A0A7L5BT46_9RHOB|nr:acyl-CoA dehydrogenase [Pikeienuella piscinae]QIE54081.1 acyl-CoA dehydrogenase [Pikeienuella piscinae]
MSFRSRYLTAPIMRWAEGALPPLSDTEREALEAGDTWWDVELFSGSPDWSVLLDTPAPVLTENEQAFLDGPCVELCGMLDDWAITNENRDLSPEVWRFMREKRFFGMIIPENRGGLGFSAYAQSEVIRRISTRSITAGVTVMVPNSLGPGELLMQYGTDAQQDCWLPRLASGEETPCFALTSPEAGSDAAAMVDDGVICKGEHEGEKVLGIRLNWRKRYITLAPVATVIGLAFKLRDPEGLLGGAEDRGITVALVPVDTPGVVTGRRHVPCGQAFQNGPTEGHDVFVPLDAIIGGEERIGQGWMMLMSALAAGRGISLPSLGAAAIAFGARTTGAYARVRRQFGIPVSKFEGVAARLGRLAGLSYQIDAGRRLTCAGLDGGRKLAVISAIMKAHATFRMRTAVNDAMDVHSGKTVIDGPKNYLGNLYRAIPIGITVEGANILTRNLIIFGQGAIRCHPHLLDEMLALEEPDRKLALERFDKAFWGHVGHAFANAGRAFVRNWSGGRIGPVPPGAGAIARHYRRVARYAASLSLVSDLALLTLGGGLKRKEMISARLGDVLSELYLMTAVLKRFEDEGRQEADIVLVDWCMASGAAMVEKRFAEVLRNLPSRPAAWLARIVIGSFGARARGPDDATVLACAALLTEPSAARERLTAGVYCGAGGDEVKTLETAFDLVVETEPLRKRMAEAKVASPDEAEARGVLSPDEAARLREADAAVAEVVEVDSFAAQALAPSIDIEKERAAAAGAA